MQKTTLTIRTLVMTPSPKKITLHTWHDLTREQAADIAADFEGQNPHLQLEAVYIIEDTWHL